jgi:hypothetical protein
MAIIGGHAAYRQCLSRDLRVFLPADAEPQGPDRPVIDHGLTHICVVVNDAGAECARLEALAECPHEPAPDGTLIERSNR